MAPVAWDHARDAPRNGKCRMHGALSTGPKFVEGRAAVARAQRKRWTKWRRANAAAQGCSCVATSQLHFGMVGAAAGGVSCRPGGCGRRTACVHMTTNPAVSPGAVRMRRLRARRRKTNMRVLAIEIDALDCAALWMHDFLLPGESAANREHLARALRRMLNSLRSTIHKGIH